MTAFKPCPVKVSRDEPVNNALSSEDLVRELLDERRKDRRGGYVRAGLLAGVAMLYIGASWFLTGKIIPGAALDTPSQPFAAVVEIKGAIGPDTMASHDRLRPMLQKAFEHPQTKGVILQINSPGGTPVQSGLIHDTIVEFKQKYKKPVIAVGEDSMTSGAYFIAVAADQIVVNRSTVAGSIGVISAGFGFNNFIEKLGIDRRVTTAGSSKNLADPFSAESKETIKTKRVLLDAIHGHFKDTVMAGRGDRLDMSTAGLFEGAVWSGSDAVKYGLADELGDIHSAAKTHLGTEQVVTLRPKRPFMETMLDNLSIRAANLVANTSSHVPLYQPAP